MTEFRRWIAGRAEELWVVGHTTSERRGSSVWVVRLDASRVTAGGKAAAPLH